MRFRGTTLFGRRLSARRTLFCPMSRGRAASLLSMCNRGRVANRTSRPGARRSGRSSGVNSGLLAAGGLAAGGPPSLCGDAVRPDLSVNAVVKMIAYLRFLTRSTAHEPRRTCRPARIRSSCLMLSSVLSSFPNSVKTATPPTKHATAMKPAAVRRDPADAMGPQPVIELRPQEAINLYLSQLAFASPRCRRRSGSLRQGNRAAHARSHRYGRRHSSCRCSSSARARSGPRRRTDRTSGCR